jgi:hypothetical protein
VAAVLLLSGCAKAEQGVPRLEFRVSNVAPAWESDDGTGAAFSNIIEVLGGRSVRVTELRPIADAGLRVRYLGVCHPGCPGAVGLTEGIRTVRENLVATLPFEVHPGEARSLAFTLEPNGTLGMRALQTRCLRLNAVAMILETGERLVVRYPSGDFVNALRAKKGQCFDWSA